MEILDSQGKWQQVVEEVYLSLWRSIQNEAHARYARHVGHWLCVPTCVWTIKPRPFSRVWAETIARCLLTALFSRSVRTMCRHRIPVLSPAGMTVMTGDKECHQHSDTKKVSVSGNGIFTAPELPPTPTEGTRDQRCTMRFQQWHGNWSLEPLTPFSCPHQAFQRFIITNETLSLTGIKGLSSFFCFPPMGKDPQETVGLLPHTSPADNTPYTQVHPSLDQIA